MLNREEAQSQLHVLCWHHHHHVNLVKTFVFLCLLPFIAPSFAAIFISKLLSLFKGSDRDQSPYPHAKQEGGRNRNGKCMLLPVLALRRVRLVCAMQFCLGQSSTDVSSSWVGKVKFSQDALQVSWPQTGSWNWPQKENLCPGDQLERELIVNQLLAAGQAGEHNLAVVVMPTPH